MPPTQRSRSLCQSFRYRVAQHKRSDLTEIKERGEAEKLGPRRDFRNTESRVRYSYTSYVLVQCVRDKNVSQ